eukprot:TRINITY_DN16551_c0_g3_i1.p1 TRINITY_DN16551_c0_g3~~TRINITY_DN16551_c0_g3_i1.p1  ORF type:complete len:432 (-),score=25.05 TRINITY_DN16551_c0_g3_i1:245-1459(-)
MFFPIFSLYFLHALSSAMGYELDNVYTTLRMRKASQLSTMGSTKVVSSTPEIFGVQNEFRLWGINDNKLVLLPQSDLFRNSQGMAGQKLLQPQGVPNLNLKITEWLPMAKTGTNKKCKKTTKKICKRKTAPMQSTTTKTPLSSITDSSGARRLLDLLKVPAPINMPVRDTPLPDIYVEFQLDENEKRVVELKDPRFLEVSRPAPVEIIFSPTESIKVGRKETPHTTTPITTSTPTTTTPATTSTTTQHPSETTTTSAPLSSTETVKSKSVKSKIAKTGGSAGADVNVMSKADTKETAVTRQSEETATFPQDSEDISVAKKSISKTSSGIFIIVFAGMSLFLGLCFVLVKVIYMRHFYDYTEKLENDISHRQLTPVHFSAASVGEGTTKSSATWDSFNSCRDNAV